MTPLDTNTGRALDEARGWTTPAARGRFLGGRPRLSILRDFFKWAVLRGEIHGDPTLPIERARSRQVYRETLCSRRGWLAVRAAWWALDWCRYWLTPAVIRRHLTDRGY